MPEQEIQRQAIQNKGATHLSTAEIEFTNKLNSLREEAINIRDVRERDWASFIDLARNRGHYGKRRPKYKVDGIINIITPTIERKTALLTDTKPTIDVKPRKGSGKDASAEILKKTIDGILAECNFDQKLAELITISQICGCSFVNTMWDNSLDFGSGDINIFPADPRTILVDPYIGRSYRVDRGEFIIIDDIISLDKARDLYPHRADYIRASAEHSSYSLTHKTGKQSYWAKFYVPFRRHNRPSVIPRTLRSEFWIKDRYKDSRTGKYFFNGAVRRVVVCGGAIVGDGGNPYWDGKFPVDMLDWHFDIDSPYGWGDVELLRSPQKMINKLVSTTLENAILMSNAIWIGDKDALSKEDWRKLTNEPGSHVKVRRGRNLKREMPPQMPEYIPHMVQFLQQVVGEMSGMVPTMMGRRSGQVSSGVGVEQLQMAAQAIIRLKARALEGLIARVGQKLIARIFQYYTADRLMNFLGDQEEFEQFKYIRTELIGEKEGVKNNFKDYMFLVAPGSGLAMSRVQKGIVATQLYQLGIIDELELLTTMEYPNAEVVAQKAMRRRADAAKVAANQPNAGQRNAANRQVKLAGRI